MTSGSGILTRGIVVCSLVWALLGAQAAHAEGETTPINCSTAEGDIRALNSEKEYARSHRLAEASAIIPAGALLGIATGTEGEKLEMLSPEYERRIDARIAEIKETCGLT
ncbi:MAG: hypothetical protein AAGC86_13755 [Pseudomonadota bacterium]